MSSDRTFAVEEEGSYESLIASAQGIRVNSLQAVYKITSLVVFGISL